MRSRTFTRWSTVEAAGLVLGEELREFRILRRRLHTAAGLSTTSARNIMFMAHQSFTDRLLGSRYAWLLLDQDGTTRLATPPGFPTPVELATHEVEQVVTRLGELPGWGLIVSLPRSHPDFHHVVKTLVGKGGRPLRQDEWVVIQDAGMEIPFGEWATDSWADLFLFEEGARG